MLKEIEAREDAERAKEPVKIIAIDGTETITKTASTATKLVSNDEETKEIIKTDSEKIDVSSLENNLETLINNLDNNNKIVLPISETKVEDSGSEKGGLTSLIENIQYAYNSSTSAINR
eukprot:UN10714